MKKNDNFRKLTLIALINIYILKLKYVENTKIPMAESLTSVQFFGFLVKIPIAKSLTPVYFFFVFWSFYSPPALLWFCDTLLPCVFLWTFFFCCQLHVSSSVYLFLFFFSKTEISPECWSQPLFAMHSLFFFFFICCSLWSLLEDLTEPLRTFSPVRVVSFHSSFYSFCVFFTSSRFA